MEATKEILTVGHSTHPLDLFVELLRGAGVEAIADVRRFPSSRRNPQFNAKALERSLAQAGIAYEPFGEELGGRRGEDAFVACAEWDWRNCHRRLIADALAARGWRVVHLLPDGRLEPHPTALELG